jgi:hypothetical protein
VSIFYLRCELKIYWFERIVILGSIMI